MKDGAELRANYLPVYLGVPCGDIWFQRGDVASLLEECDNSEPFPMPLHMCVPNCRSRRRNKLPRTIFSESSERRFPTCQRPL